MLLIGNNILGKDNNNLSDNSVNQNTNMQYIDIDSDASTFSSSSANLKMPSTSGCSKIAYAGLYWGAILQVPQNRSEINKIKLKLPGNTTYTDVTGELIYDAVVDPIAAGTNEPTNTPYACYADLTTLISGLADPQGTYTVANVTSSLGFNSTTGLSAGWTLFIVYENDAATKKSITSFDGFSSIYDDKTLSIPISGFITPPSGTINILYAFASLEGDKGEVGSKTEINGKAITNSQRASNRFFNSIITDGNGYFTDRIPNNSNSLGYDTGIETVLSAEKSVINYNATSATITVQVAKGQANPIFSFFNAFAVDVIAPEIKLTKIVEDINGNDIGNTNVTLGDNLYYEIGFQNIGNDNVKNFTLKDVLPKNVIFNYPSDIISLPTGVTHTYNSTTRTLEFSIPNTLVEVNSLSQTIRLHVQLVSDYNQITDACDNVIKNQALASYQGVINTKQIVDEGSYSSTTCNFGTPQSTNFLVNINGQTFSRNEVLCGASVQLSAADGYDSYSWSSSSTGTPVIGTNQTYTATDTGTYYVTSTSDCATITEVITVIPFGNTITNPVIPYADEVVICQNNGKELPNIFLCGANSSRYIQTNISDASTIQWEKLDESSCPAQTITNCANENTACQWNVVGTGPNFLANTSGQFRVTLLYPGGCFSRFYFNVYQNLLNPTATSRDIICTTIGQITIGGVPSGYEYSLNSTDYQPSNIFPIATAGAYTVYIRQVGVTTNPCIFTVQNILVRQRNFSTSTIVSQPLCYGDKGSIKIGAADAYPQYYYSISQGGTLVNSVGPVTASDYEFAGLNPGTYTVRVWTDDGCDSSTAITITEPPLLSATSALTKALTCEDGEITVYPVGGTPPYNYYVNGSTSSQTTPQITVSAAGTYSIQVVDSQDCSTITSITVAAVPAPEFTISQTNILCYNDTTGAINFTVTNANGYTLTYSIDNGATYTPNPTFSNLGAGTYNAIVKYSLAGTDCFSTAQTITITQPDTAVTASAGVSELAGCGTSGEGKIRITNPQGGTAPYEYSFDNQTTWTTTNEAYLAPGTYTVYVRDANGCIYPMPNIVIDPVPVEPTINVENPAFNCDGTATATVTVTNNGGANYNYEYLIDGIPNTNVPPNVFTNVPSGTHTVSVSYQLLTVPTYSNLLKEDFGSGSEVASPGINPAFCFEKQNFITCDRNGTLNNGEYTVTNTIKNGIYSGWHNPVDHTAGSATGRYLAVDAGSAIPNNAVVYRKTIQDIIPNQPIQVRFFATNLLKVGNNQPNASLTVELQNASGVALSSESTGGIPKTNGWIEYNKTINPGDNTTLDFVLRLEIAQVNGIDFAVDDIEVYQLPKACITTKDFTVIIPTDEAFTASLVNVKNLNCSGANDGEITIAASNFDTTNGYQYSLDNGATWNTQTTSPYTITGLAPGTYNLKIRYGATAGNTCEQSFTATITAPAPLAITASVTSPANCTTGATISALATGGTPAYRYELWNAIATTNIVPSQASGSFTNVAPGSYIVRGYDANNCTDDSPVITIVAPPTLSATLAPSSDFCYDSLNQATLVVTASGGTAPLVYSLDGAPSQNSNTFTNVTPGTHEIIVTDSYNCTATISNIIIAPQLKATIPSVKELDCTSNPAAVITVSISGGNSPFTYKVKEGSASYGTSNAVTGTTFTYTTATAGSYTFEITDAKGCVTTTSATINPLVPITATLITINPLCNGDANGSVQIIPSGGVGSCTYSFNGSAFSTTSLYSGLSANIAYNYEVRDSKNCSFTGTVTLTEPTKLETTATVVPFSCSPTNTKQSATVTIVPPTTGSPSYTYSFNGSAYSSSNVLTVNDNRSDQRIDYSVRDANGCTYSDYVTISALNPPTDLSFTAAPITCDNPSTDVTIFATNGVGTLTYEIISPASTAPSNTTGVFTGLLPGTYIFKVTDENGCYYTESHTVLPVTHIAVSGNVTSDVLCKGDNTGSAVFTVSGFSDKYSYSINGGTLITTQTAATININNLTADTYTINITDEATSCTATATVTITEPTAPLALTATATNINCNNDNAQITVNATGGTPNYSYAAVVNGSAAPTTYTSNNVVTVDTNSGSNLSWDVYVKDANGCIEMTTITIASEPLPTVTTPSLASNQCDVASGFTFTVSGTGVAPLRYSINGGTTYQNSPTFTVNTPRSYTVTIIDGNGCTAQSPTPTVIYPKLTLNVRLDKVITCSSPADAQITLTAANGNSSSYTYAYSTDGSTFTVMASNVFNTTTPGSYTFKVTDHNGCAAISSSPIVLTIPVNPEIIDHTQTQDIYCNGESTASIRVNINSAVGLAPFSYSIDGTNFQSSNVFSSLAAGNYTITLKDANGCADTYDLTIDQPDALNYTISKTDIQCASTSLGSITVNVDALGLGGTAPYTYILTNNVGEPTQSIPNATGTNFTFSNLNFGTYYLTVVDANGCSLKTTTKVTSPPDNLDIVVESTADCASGGTVSVTATGPLLGSGPFYFAKYEKDPITGLYPTSPTFIAGVVQPPFQEEDTPGTPHTSTFNGLIQGVIYSFIVYDAATDCSYIKEASAPTIKATSLATLRVVTDVTCKGANDGTVSITLNTNSTDPLYSPPTSVDYAVYDSKTNLPLSPSNNGSGIAVGAYPFVMPLIGGLAPGSYYVVITEHGGSNDGCMSATLPFDIYESATALEVTATVVKNDNCNLNAGQIVAIAKGGTTMSREDALAVPPQVATAIPYQYQILTDTDTPPLSNDSNWGTTNTFYKEAGNYIVYAMDANKCIQSYPIQLQSDDAPTIDTPAPICYNGNPFTITITGTVDPDIVGNKTYSINGSGFQSSPNFTFNAAGTYNLVIKDGNDCTANVDYIVYPQLQLDAALTKELDCTTPNPDAAITLTATGGNTSPSASYAYESSPDGTNWSTMVTNVFSATTAGTYYFRVTDNNNPTSCQATTNLTIDPKTPTIFTTIETDVLCNGGNTGSITVTVTSGEGPYEYKLDGPVSYPYQPSNQFTGLTAGNNYVVTVRNSKRCEYSSAPITITEPTPLAASSDLTTALSCGTGNAAQVATVTVTGINGTAPYTYSYNGGLSYTSSNTYQSYTGTTFNVWVKDANGCIFTLPNGVDIPALDPPTDLDFNGTPVYCIPVASQTSTVMLTTTKGVAPLSYAIVFPASATSNVTGASSGIFTNLTPDTYLFEVKDANGCTYQEAYTVDPVTNITVSGQLISDVTCNGNSNGVIQFTVANFSGTYSYSINGTPTATGQSNATITLPGLATRTYTIVVTDETTGCEATTSVTVSEPTLLDLTETTNIHANCNFGAQVSVTASGGIAPYSYAFVPNGTTAVATDYTNSPSAVLDPAISTTWDVWVKDANGCVIANPLAITIATDPLPTVAVNPYSECPSATGEYTFTINVTSGIAPYEYSIGSGFQSSPTFTVTASGSYDVTVRDANGCTTTVTGLVNILSALQLEADITALPSCTDGDGTLTLTASGGSGSYEYSLDGGTPQSSADFINLTAGAHTATVKDLTTNCTYSIQVSLEAATPVTGFALSKTDVSCNGGSDGVITASMATPAPGVNDNPVYLYSLSGDAVRTPQQSNIFSGLAAGNYTVTVTSARGCTAIDNIEIIDPALIVVPAPDVVQFGCNPGSNANNFATITVNGVTGGSGAYNYEFIKDGTRVQFGTNNVYTEADLLGGNYTVNVYDDKGCPGAAPAAVTIDPYIALDKINVTVNNTITCANLEDITVSATTIGGPPASLQYTLVDVSGAIVFTPNTNGIFTGLAVGEYIITVTNPTTGCSIQDVHYVNEPNTFDLNINNITDVSCYGGTNGSVDITFIDRVPTPTDEAGGFSYTVTGSVPSTGISPTAGPFTITNLAAGTYTITATLTNSPYCSVTKNFSISQPSAALNVTETHTEITCISGNNDGSISATATGGWPGGYQYELVGPVNVAYSSQSTFTNLTAGNYTVNVRDSKGCVASANVTLVIPTPISITASSNAAMVSCFGDKTATITVNTTTGGQGSNYMYTLNTTSLTPATSSGPQASPVFSGLGAGTYAVSVTDGYNCTATSTPIVITEPSKVIASLVVASTQTCTTQTTLTLSATGGTGTYSYSSDANFTTVLGSFASSVTFPVAPGTYAYYVRDSNGCTSVISNQIKIDPLPPLTIDIDRTNAVINCAGDNTGVIVATAQGGLGNYSYTLLDGSGATVQGPSASGNFTGLFAGDYQIKVDSGDCNTTSAVITITQPLVPLTATGTITPVSCNGANNGIYTVTASGGTGIIKYAISPNLNQFFDSSIFENLAPGHYDVIVQDQLGCYVRLDFDMTEPAPISATVDPTSIVPEVCYGDNDAAFSIDIAGGVLPYSVILDDPNGTFTTGAPTQTRFDFTGITGGTHIVYIIDANSCSYELEVPLEESVKINPVALVDYSCVNNAAANSVTVTVDPSITNPADLDYSLDGGNYQSANIFTNITPGTAHYIDVRHTNGCIKRTPAFDILQVDPLTLTLTDGGLNEIVATAAGGGGGYQYTFNGEDNGTKNTYIIYKSGDYTVQVTDANGCTATATRYFEYIDVCIPNYFTPNGDGISDGWAPGCTINYKDLTFDIFDRYGRKIATYHLGQTWDGKYNGQELPSGDYWFVLKLNDPKDNRDFVGHFTLYR
ncbi:putative hemagglutinin/hemolysin-like protein [Flavobacterium daejeonense]|nr:putative hemagglutinin/hemolysin-like protein [Flavobacterium daejeonense]